MTEVPETLFSLDNLSDFTIDGIEYNDYKCTNFWSEADGIHFILHELTSTDKLNIRLEETIAELAYVAMMSDIDVYSVE